MCLYYNLKKKGKNYKKKKIIHFISIHGNLGEEKVTLNWVTLCAGNSLKNYIIKTKRISPTQPH